MKKNIPFVVNHSDGTYCFQAALAMILQFFTDKKYSFEELNKLSQKLTGKWTWPTASLLWLLDHGYEIKLIETFSYEEFGKKGKDYLIKAYGLEVANAQEANSDLPREQKLALEFSKKGCVENRIPDWNDLKELFNEGYLIICNINACSLYRKEGYSGHFVVPTSIAEDDIIIHDPGLPPHPSFKVKREVFEKGWGYPNDRAKNILAIRKKGTFPSEGNVP
ncbi:MAG: hypothetical protein A2W61_05540 [Deltaproteobacteria bacterium RIFCSPLOWO2_01_44_7]|nr:MAG: hypothetical protein A2712_09755 [Deltaproteobacteria bacterium RIFCSPHIGHO2_01_FULL_43_49]OGQ15397.1 MAG: hypothetical protein A3D22_10285 [Deltaproteobacteria bacterium RIFCSPHIGHO2_02_FULL_44_53]OGQ29591.1 MAG: hypothetical protein A3D98_10485 [Deltaproteobacteria bacterium RIFCSPHIGHO2_12_FULL_44_21]OGQ32204.1 MAG: hypothetical protein A2979_00130 [Deltaproteobacteria bacterium RIFCSPLOWO2_01_FULL_45_74]OGQ43504.1 MAG: hypothetical protein A2W61_05540 [Deltaproteobacteria bacterium 